MSRDNTSTPGRGETWYEGATPDSNDNFEGVLGVTKVFEDVDWGASGNVKPYRIGIRGVVCRLVKNVSGQTLYGKRLVQLDPTNPNHILGYQDTLAKECYPLDEFLPAGGLVNNDLGWIVIKGPAMCLTGFAGADFQTTSIAAGDRLIATTVNGGTTAAGTTGTAGRVAVFAIAAATTAGQFTQLLDAATNWIGRALTARTSGNTNTDILVDVNRERNGYP